MILVVAATPEVAALAASFLDERGVEVVRAGAEFESTLARHREDIEAIVIGQGQDEQQALDVATDVHAKAPEIAIVLIQDRAGTEGLRLAMRAGVTDVVSGTLTREELTDAVSRACEETRLIRARAAGAAPAVQGARDGMVVTIFSSKGGSGKSTMATNLACLLAQFAPNDTVLVDLDLQSGDASVLLHLVPQWTIHDAAAKGASLDTQQLEGFLTAHSVGLRVLAAPSLPEQADDVDGSAATHILGLLRERFRYVIIDGPATFTDPLLAAVDMSDLVVLIASLDVPSVKNLRTTMHTLGQMGIADNRIRRMLNRADSKVGLTVREVERSLGVTIDLTIPSSREVPLSVNQGRPLALSQPKSTVVRALLPLRDEIAPGAAGSRVPDPPPVTLADEAGPEASSRSRGRRGARRRRKGAPEAEV